MDYLRETTVRSPKARALSQKPKRDIFKKTRLVRKLDYQCLMAQLKKHQNRMKERKAKSPYLCRHESPLLPYLQIQQNTFPYNAFANTPEAKIFGETIDEIEKKKTKKLINIIEDVHKNIELLAASRVFDCKKYALNSPRNLKLVCQKLMVKKNTKKRC
ncbi:unnamed protein product [Moneuplotes crassus]|uniref:Uncharacterized protein n=1 Tax=Euplotes crassus TaxID=5936 RepID=A0AAD1X7Q7_EUPCR|nr:unnamed protein product [Moneuplotes crassus]